jgi:hypothetical protein
MNLCCRKGRVGGCPVNFGKAGVEVYKFDQKLPWQGALTGAPLTLARQELKIAHFRIVFF